MKTEVHSQLQTNNENNDNLFPCNVQKAHYNLNVNKIWLTADQEIISASCSRFRKSNGLMSVDSHTT